MANLSISVMLETILQDIHGLELLLQKERRSCKEKEKGTVNSVPKKKKT